MSLLAHCYDLANTDRIASGPDLEDIEQDPNCLCVLAELIRGELPKAESQPTVRGSCDANHTSYELSHP